MSTKHCELCLYTKTNKKLKVFNVIIIQTTSLDTFLTFNNNNKKYV